jgi:hypothetical protein
VNSSPPIRIVLPTESAPPNNCSLVRRDSTTTRSLRLSCAASQPPPNRNGTSKMPNMSPWVNNTLERNGLMSSLAGSTGSTLGNIAACRVALPASYSAIASR